MKRTFDTYVSNGQSYQVFSLGVTLSKFDTVFTPKPWPDGSLSISDRLQVKGGHAAFRYYLIANGLDVMRIPEWMNIHKLLEDAMRKAPGDKLHVYGELKGAGTNSSAGSIYNVVPQTPKMTLQQKLNSGVFAGISHNVAAKVIDEPVKAQVCECGAASVGAKPKSPMHSSWCQLR